MTDDDGLELYRMLEVVCDTVDVLLPEVDLSRVTEEGRAALDEYAAMRRYMVDRCPCRVLKGTSRVPE